MDSLQRSGGFLSRFAKSYRIHVIDQADTGRWCGVLVAGINEVGIIVEEEVG